jgi:hypothetical protein
MFSNRKNRLKDFIFISLLYFTFIILKVEPTGVQWMVDNFVGSGMQGLVNENTAATSADIYPNYIFGDSMGNMFVGMNRRIVKIASSLPHNVSSVAGIRNCGTAFETNNVAGTSTPINSLTSLWADSVGNVFYGDGAAIIRKIAVNNNIVTTLVGIAGCTTFSPDNTTGTSACIATSSSLFGDSLGNLYFTEQSPPRIRIYYGKTTLRIGTIAGTGTNSFSGDGGPAIAATISTRACGLYIDSSGNLYFSDQYNVRIRKIEKATGIITTIAGNGNLGYSGNNQPALSTSLYYATSIWVNTVGVVYYFDDNVYLLRKIVGGITTTVAGKSMHDFSGDGGPATNADMTVSFSIWGDTNGNMFVADLENFRIRKITPSQIISTYAGTGTFTEGGMGGPATSAQISAAQRIWMNSNGHAFITDCGLYRCRIKKVDSQGIISVFAGTSYNGNSPDNTPLSSVQFASLAAIWGDTLGNMYFAVQPNAAVLRKISTSNIVTSVSGMQGGSTADNIALTSANLGGTVMYLYGDTMNNLYFSIFPNCVRKISLTSNIISTFAGQLAVSSPFIDNVPATQATIAVPLGIWIDSGFNMFIAEYSNHRIRKVTNEIISTYAGTGTCGYDSGTFLPKEAKLCMPNTVMGDSNGNLFIGDTANYRVRMIYKYNSTTNYMITIAGSASGLVKLGVLWAPTALFQVQSLAIDRNNVLYFTDGSSQSVKKLYSVDNPTGQPSSQPSTHPSGQPTRQPSVRPTCQPTSQPTSRPTSQPSVRPTCQPTRQPTSQPTSQPGGKPTTRPTTQPTSSPSTFTSFRSVQWMADNFIGTGIQGFTTEKTAATAADIYPNYITGDSMGNIFVGMNNRVAKIDALSPRNVTTIAGAKNIASVADSNNVLATSTNIAIVTGIWADSVGNVFYLDRALLLRKIAVNTNIVTTVVGTGCIGFSPDGTDGVTACMGSSYSVFGDSTGNLYYAEQDPPRIRIYYGKTTLKIGTVAGTGIISFSGDAGPATSATISNGAQGLFVDTSGNIFFIDKLNHRIRKIDKATGIINTIAGTGTAGYNGNNMPALSTLLYYSTSLWVETTGIVYYFDDFVYLLRKIVGGIITTVAGKSLTHGYSGDGGAATNADVSLSLSIWGDSIGNMYIGDLENHRIRKITPSQIISTYAGTGEFIDGAIGGSVALAQLSGAQSVFADSAGNAFINDIGSFNCKIKKVSSQGIVTVLAGGGYYGDSPDGLPLTSTLLSALSGIWGDTQGNIYFGQQTGVGRIRKISTANALTTVVGFPGGSTANNIALTSASLGGNVMFVYGDTANNLFFSTTGHWVRKVNLNANIISTFAGQLDVATPFTDNIQATQATFHSPIGIWINSNYQFFIADNENHRIRKITNGIISTIAGNNAPVCSNYNPGPLPATMATLCYPYSAVGDSNGNIFISDTGYLRIRMVYRFNSTMNYLLTIAGSGTGRATYGLQLGMGYGFQSQRMSIDKNNIIYFVDGTSGTVKKLFAVDFPTGQPTSEPSRQPSARPSAQPSRQPTVQPSSQPSGRPSSQPTGRPSVQPTTQPSRRPSIQPTCRPSSQPSSEPTQQPTSQPSNRPSKQPTEQPTGQPSLQPFSRPSCSPSTQPTTHPSNRLKFLTNTVNLDNLVNSQGFMIEGTNTLGFSVIGGNINGDSYADILLGAPGSNTVYLIYGSSSLSSMNFLTTPNLFLQPGIVRFVDEPGSGAGYCVCTTDINGDHLQDIIIGVPYSLSNTGKVIVVFGSRTLFPNFVSLAALPSASGFTIVGNQMGAFFGSSISSGNFNGDHYSDLIIGGSSCAGVANCLVSGRVYLVFGQSEFPVQSIVITNLLSSTSRGVSFQLGIANDLFGFTVGGLGDVNNDGFDEFAIYSYNYLTYIFSGNSSWNTVDIHITPDPKKYFWAETTVGDVNNDGFPDFALGGDRSFFICFGRSGYVAAVDSSFQSIEIVAPGNEKFQYTAYTFDTGLPFGGIGDINGDGFNDIIVGFAYSTTTSKVFIIFGKPASRWKNIVLDNLKPDEGIVLQSSVSLLGFSACILGDVNNDGFADVIFGSKFVGKSYVLYGGLSQPTSQPSLQPSTLPSRQPTALPSVQPSSSPSVQPSSQPSRKPSSQPFSRPSNQPTSQPSLQPSTSPSRQPTALPSVQPSSSPSMQPSSQPSRKPSSQPFSRPSNQPTSQPTMQPTNVPSSQPSSKPSCQPTARPTSQPVSKPSNRPSEQPTARPTRQPSSQPSTVPSNQPTSQPSSRPVSCPSTSPSSQPSRKPSVQPVSLPTGQPSSRPSMLPFSVPSCLPSCLPTSRPSNQPSMIPTQQPFSFPSSLPTGQPSSGPTTQPTCQPSRKPSVIPSSLPSGLPSTQPSVIPTLHPSGQPSSRPSGQPTSDPSTFTRRPTSHPTSNPKVQPSGCPSSFPSVQPTNQPSIVPSGCPSMKPSSQPSSTRSVFPSCQPTTCPSLMPSTHPSAPPTSQPFSVPSVCPTIPPSTHPTRIPTSCPTTIPSNHPTVAPSYQPTSVPSIYPTALPSPQPSDARTMTPAAVPTVFPTSQPIFSPFTTPTVIPSSFPVAIPSGHPSREPSVQPVSIPTSQPTVSPSCLPTKQPSSVPSSRPSEKLLVSNKPTVLPTVAPSMTPSSSVPSRIPTVPPSIRSSSLPTGQPTSNPSLLKPSFSNPLPTALPSSLFSIISSANSTTLLGGKLFLLGRMLPETATASSMINLQSDVLPEATSVIIFGEKGKKLSNINLYDAEAPAFSAQINQPLLSQETSISRSVGLVGDINQDGIKDVLVGYPVSSKCLVYLQRENSNYLNMQVSSIIYGNGNGDYFGWAITNAKDFNSDGIDDFMISALNTGIVYIIYGRRNFPKIVFASDLTKSTGMTIIGESPLSVRNTGMALSSAGDFNQDGHPDLLLSATRSNSESILYSLFGEASPLPATFYLNQTTPSPSLNIARIIFPVRSFAGFSLSSLGDIDRDGYDDIIVGSLPYQGGYGQQKSYILYGHSINFELAKDYYYLSELKPGEEMTVITGGGFQVAGAGDVNEDGCPDILVINYPNWRNNYQGNNFLLSIPRNVSASPTMLPTSFPSSSPHSLPTGVPNQRIVSSFPTNSPSLAEIDTFSPSSSVQTTFPPNLPKTGSPTVRPKSARPTKLPSFSPTTRSPTRKPTYSPSRIPSVKPATTTPSKSPISFRPSQFPTVSPTKFVFPTSFPSSYPTNAVATPYKLTEIAVSGNYTLKTGLKEEIVITGSGEVLILTEGNGKLGKKIYKVVPTQNQKITISQFQLDSDVIDFSSFPQLKSDRDITYTTNPLVFHLSSDQSIVFSSLGDFSLTEKNFIFSSDSSGHKKETIWDSSIIVPLAVLLCGVGFMILVFWLPGFYKGKDKDSEKEQEQEKPNNYLSMLESGNNSTEEPRIELVSPAPAELPSTKDIEDSKGSDWVLSSEDGSNSSSDEDDEEEEEDDIDKNSNKNSALSNGSSWLLSSKADSVDAAGEDREHGGDEDHDHNFELSTNSSEELDR